MRYQYFVLLLLLVYLGIPQTTAQELQTYPFNQNAIIEHSVRFNGAPVNANCNITVFNPRKIAIVQFAPMSFNSANQTYSFTLQPTNLTEINKVYSYDVTCLTASANATDNFEFILTQDGTTPTVEEGLAYFFLLLIGMGLFVYTVFLYFRIDTTNQSNEDGYLIKINKKKYLKMFFFAMAYIFLAWIMFTAWNLAGVYINNKTISAIFYAINIGMLNLILPFSVIWGIVVFITYVRDLRLQDSVNKGELVNAFKK